MVEHHRHVAREDAMTVALVTGAAKGIGAAVAHRLAAQFDALVLMDVDGDGLEKTAEHLKSQARIEIVARVGCQRRRLPACREGRASSRRSRPDSRTTPASSAMEPSRRPPEALWDEVFSVNLKGAFLISQAAMPLLRASKGAVVHMASVQGFAAQTGVVAYSAAKHGLDRPGARHGRRRRALWRPRQRGGARLCRHADAA